MPFRTKAEGLVRKIAKETDKMLTNFVLLYNILAFVSAKIFKLKEQKLFLNALQPQ